jgi:hypothetical protein
MPKIKESLLKRLREDEDLQLDIAKAMKKRTSTIKTWIRYEDELLTSKAVVLVIKDLTGLPESDILEPEPATA